jgi:predicted ATPase
VRELPTGTVTFLFTDVESSTRLLHELGPERYAEALASYRRMAREAFATNGGVEVDTQGDAFFVAFGSAPDAVAAAAQAQAALEGGPIRVRMGLHTGTPTPTEEGYVGEDVHLGARIAAAGHGGQVLASKATVGLVGAELTDLGEHRLKDFDEPVWIYQLGDSLFPPLKTISNTNLPRPASSFVGREREVAEVVSLLQAGTRLVTLTGPGGSGKTRLAIEAASELVGDFRNGAFWVGLATVRDAKLVVPAVAHSLGAQDELAEHVGGRELLLLLDNLEHVIDVAPELAGLVEACPNLRLLVTSRELLRVRGEVEYEVLPLAEPDAVELFSDRAAMDPSAAIEELCRRLDNMPLALELAAARAKVLSPEQILELLGRRLDLFKGGRDADPRQQTLRATIEWSHELLTQEDRRLFARLSVFSGCTLEAASAVCEAELDGLQSLVEKSLVRHTNERFWMLETIRGFALERLEEDWDAEEVRHRHAEFFLALAESANLTAEAEGGRRHDVVLPERANLRGAIDWCLAAGEVELGLSIAVALENFWATENPFEGVRTFEALLGAEADIPAVLHARALRCYGGSSQLCGQRERAQAAFEESLELFQAVGTERDIAVLLHRIGNNAVQCGNLELARARLEESLAIFRRVGSRRGEAQAVGSLGYLARSEGDRERAVELFAKSAGMAAELGFRWWEAGMLDALADCALDAGNLQEASAYAREMLFVARSIQDRLGTVYGLAYLACIAAGKSEFARAGRLWGAVEAEEARGPLGGWEAEREQFAGRVLGSDGPELEAARPAGRRLTLEEAVQEALSGR